MKISFAGFTKKQRKLFGLGLSSLLAFLVTLSLFSIPSIHVLEWRLADFWVQKVKNRPLSNDVAVIGVDESILDEYGWPLEKDIYGDCIDYLNEMGAKAIAFDITFSDNLESCGKSDSIFRAMISLSPNVVLGYGFLSSRDMPLKSQGKRLVIPQKFSFGKCSSPGIAAGGAVLPYPQLLEKTSCIGFFNLAPPFSDGIDRYIPLWISQDSSLYPSLALETSFGDELTKKKTVRIDANSFSIRGKHIPTNRTGYMYVNFIDSIPVYNLSALRQSQREWLLGKEPQIGKKQLDGRVVFIGNIALSLGDFGLTPRSCTEQLGITPKVMMHAYAAETLLKGNALNYHKRSETIMLSVAIAIFAALLFYFFPAYWAFICSAILFCGLILLNQRLYLNNHVFPVLECICSGIVSCIFCSLAVYLEKEFDRRYLYTVFGHYLSTKIIEEMYKKNEKPILGGVEAFGTAFFTDIENFSTFSEELGPQELITSLNEYFEVMTRILLDHKGTLDKFIGDAIVAFFGAPQASHTHAHDACTTAVRMQEALAELREKWRKNDYVNEKVKNLKMRIGVNTGKFIAGNIGCSLRMNYTMIGDTVNLAARLESAAKQYGIYTVVGEETYNLVKNDFQFRCLDRIRVKGRTQPTSIYQLLGAKRENDDKIIELVKRFEYAMDLYFKGDFSGAAVAFGESLRFELYPDLKNPSQVLRDRCLYLSQNQPDVWDGVYEMKTK